MSKHYNPGKVNVEKAAEGIVKSGGGMNSSQKDGYTHNTAYSRDENRHISWDKHSDGSITNVHTDKDGKSYTQYKGGK